MGHFLCAFLRVILGRTFIVKKIKGSQSEPRLLTLVFLGTVKNEREVSADGL